MRVETVELGGGGAGSPRVESSGAQIRWENTGTRAPFVRNMDSSIGGDDNKRKSSSLVHLQNKELFRGLRQAKGSLVPGTPSPFKRSSTLGNEVDAEQLEKVGLSAARGSAMGAGGQEQLGAANSQRAAQTRADDGGRAPGPRKELLEAEQGRGVGRTGNGKSAAPNRGAARAEERLGKGRAVLRRADQAESARGFVFGEQAEQRAGGPCVG